MIYSGIKNGDLIELEGKSTYKVYVKTLTGKTLTIYVEPFDTIHFAKCLINSTEGILVMNKDWFFRRTIRR